ncbi:Inner membrane protein YgaP [Anatilimnocola aggregata]|uniref:Inner membrane protein YgaP n=1 Tax=Anatilimnocola aggregata TaxID=2528021 RepID=A0A517YM49_9BACT|nr:rhodanese-like domain-containing protein [Anatilimnocola aggregata]QDU31308.1 Inner membrane protein YgaP [Anatilimnocola aggregata]
MTQTITPQDFQRLCQSGQDVELIDVRTPVEFQEMHVEIAKNVPLDRLDPQRLQQERTTGEAPLYVICRSGGRGKQACEKFQAAGVTNVINVEGGTMACAAAGMSMVRGKKAVSLERQVRIAAGSLVFVGSALGYFVHPYFIGLPAFVGAGLVFAGVTDTCGMGMMLARMPWNQVASPGGSCALPK